MQIHRCSPISATMATILYIVAGLLLAGSQSEARSMSSADQDDATSAVIPSPNQLFDDETSDIFRKTEPLAQSRHQQAVAMSASPVPVYASQYVVPEQAYPPAGQPESSQPSVDFASRSMEIPSDAMPETRRPNKDLKVAASYGHGHHGSHHGGHHQGAHHDEHHGHGKGAHGWLDMGAYTGKKGSFGWHADFPVGGKHGYGK